MILLIWTTSWKLVKIKTKLIKIATFTRGTAPIPIHSIENQVSGQKIKSVQEWKPRQNDELTWLMTTILWDKYQENSFKRFLGKVRMFQGKWIIFVSRIFDDTNN